jgi:hypothetical protein
VREHFEVVELPPTHVKGKSQPLKIFNVVRERAGSFSSDLTRPQ